MALVIEIDQHSDVPIYEQLRRRVIAAIAHGELAPGTRLPSVRSLAVDLGVNLHTVNKAYALLRDEGYITMRRGSGASVTEPAGPGSGVARNAARHVPGTSDAADGRKGDANGHGTPPERIVAELHRLILAHKALGGDMTSFLDATRLQCERIYDDAPQGDSDRQPATIDHGTHQSGGTL